LTSIGASRLSASPIRKGLVARPDNIASKRSAMSLSASSAPSSGR
jgi:hypothetical protein